MMTNMETQKTKAEQRAAKQGMTVAEYKRRSDINTARNKGLSPAEYSRKKVEDAAKKKNMTVAEYKKQCYENTAIKKNFRSYKDYDKAAKNAKRFGITREQYNNTLAKDEEGFYIV